jgi:hypothetical protein
VKSERDTEDTDLEILRRYLANGGGFVYRLLIEKDKPGAGEWLAAQRLDSNIRY